MDSYVLVASLLWTSFALSLIALIAGIVLVHGAHRVAALVLLFIAEVGTLTFSFIGGFSIGRFTAVVPVLISGYVIGIGRSRGIVGAWVAGAAAMYLLFSWLFTPLGFDGGLPALLFGFWAIPVYAVLALVAFGSSFARQVRHAKTV